MSKSPGLPAKQSPRRHRPLLIAATSIALGVVAAASGLVSPTGVAFAATTNAYLSDMTPSSAPVNGLGPYERDLSNGESLGGDGAPLQIGGKSFAKGLGVHARSELRFGVPAGCKTFSAQIGVDDEVGSSGSVVFEVWNGTKRRLYRSSVRTGAHGPAQVSISLGRVVDLRLVVTEGRDTNSLDHADWADAKFVCDAAATTATTLPSTTTTTLPSTTTTTLAPTTTTTAVPLVTTYLSDLEPSVTPINGWGPYERDRSNGEDAAGDGIPLSVGATGFSKGLGVHSSSDIRYTIPSTCSAFTSQVGIDDEVGSNGTAVFEVWNGTSALLYQSSAKTGADGPTYANVPINGVTALRLVVTPGPDNDWYDHADWADAKVVCSEPVATTPTTTTSTTTSTTTTTLPAIATDPAPAGAITSGSRVGFATSYLPLWQPDADLARDFDAVAGTGAKWVRISFPWSTVQASGPTSWNWAPIDRAVQAARARGMQVLANPSYTPEWARPGTSSDKYPPANNADYATFVRAAVARYGPQGIKAWEIWNEPNVSSFWMPKPDAAAYVRLLRAGYDAVKAVDPLAQVISAGVAHSGGTLDTTSADGLRISPYRFVNQMYAAGAKGAFDALGLHPYAAFPYAPSADLSWNTFQQADDIHALMTSMGDGGLKIWATEAGYHTAQHPDGVTEAQQAEYAVQYLDLWDDWAFTGPFFLYMPRDRGTDMAATEENFGLLFHNDFTPKAAYGALATAIG